MSIALNYDPVQRLEEVTARLVGGPPGSLPTKIFSLENGEQCPLWQLFEIPGEVSVVHFFMPEGGVFVKHKHDEMECLIPYSGRIIDLMLKNPESVGPKEVLRINPGKAHRIKAIEDTWGIGVTVPSSDGYPHAER